MYASALGGMELTELVDTANTAMFGCGRALATSNAYLPIAAMGDLELQCY